MRKVRLLAGKRVEHVSGQVAKRDVPSGVVPEDEDALDDVLEFPDVPGPGVAQKGLADFGGQRNGPPAGPLPERVDEDVREFDDVLAAAAQRREFERQHRNPVVQVAPEGPFGDLCVQVVARGADDAEGNLPLLSSADRAEGARVEEPQELPLQGKGHAADLVEEERPLVGDLRKPRPVGGRSREGAPETSEKLRFEQGFRDGGAVQRHELAPVARRGVDEARDDLLSRSALAAHEDVHVPVGGDLPDEILDAPHFGRRTRKRDRGPALHAADPAGERDRFGGACDHVHRGLQREGLVEVVVRALLDRAHDDRRIAERRHDDDPRFVRTFQDVRDGRQPVAVREADVQKDDFRASRVEQTLERREAFGGFDGVSALFERHAKALREVGFVFDDPDVHELVSSRPAGIRTMNVVPCGDVAYSIWPP